ncbi:MAG: HDIG domain-containing protein [Dehalococcoidales bacterium]|jgi:putative nucleotidyltransferase with HDIG domain|nr:HDIG domain-containing protein [Dehalococcoidales bacterium]MDD4466027.1 HDIG domain-containing protein [Dehalococcoidales bacterium]
MNRQEALDRVQEKVGNQNLVKHMLATEAIMRALAIRLGEDEQIWGLTGLLHDIDMEICEGNMDTHSKIGSRMILDMGVGQEIANAVLRHNEAHGYEPQTSLDKALFCSDALTGLITTTALVRPDKKLASVEMKSIKKKYKEKGFAAGVNREQIETCRNLGLELDEFIELGLKAMQSVSDDLGL